jgi:hypothetical protein
MMKHAPGRLKAMQEAMQAYGKADMDCLRLVDFTGIHTAVDLGGPHMCIMLWKHR